jgi:four helix bundle protein
MQDYGKLVVWQKAHALTIEIYRITTNFPKEEMFGLTSQMRRASVSIGSNIAEGCGRGGKSELGRFL